MLFRHAWNSWSKQKEALSKQKEANVVGLQNLFFRPDELNLENVIHIFQLLEYT